MSLVTESYVGNNVYVQNVNCIRDVKNDSEFMFVYAYRCKELQRKTFMYWTTRMQIVSQGLNDIICFKATRISLKLTE
jgi:hypothetical protein